MYSIGITGHRDIFVRDKETLGCELRNEINKVQKSHPGEEIVMLNSLAAGADRLAADVAIEMGLGIIAVLPFSVSEYEKDFKGEELTAFRRQLAYADKVVTVSCEGSFADLSRDEGYRAAGIYVAEHSDEIVAFWNEVPAEPGGCGTASIVEYIRAYFPQKLRLIKTDRISDSDALAMKNQKGYLSALKAMGLIGMAMVCAFLFYDEVYLLYMLFIYIALFGVGGAVLQYARKRRFHENYMFYRMLAESLRVQKVLDLSGIEKLASDFYPMTTGDIREAIAVELNAVDRQPAEEDLSVLRRDWLEDQRRYHNSALAGTGRKIRRNRIVSAILLAATVVTCVISCVVELRNIPYRTNLIIVVGLLSAASLFLNSYYGKLNLDRKYEEHVSMEKLYKGALEETKEKPLNREFIEKIAREEMLENAGWYSYTRESSLTLDY